MPAASAPKRTVRQLAAIRLSELYHLATFRHRHGVTIDPSAWRFVLASTLAVGGPDGVRHAGKGRLAEWSGLDVSTLDSASRQCGLAPIDHEELAEIVDKAARWRDDRGRLPMTSDRVAAVLGVTAEERWACRVGTIGAVDETKAERQARKTAAETERSTKRRRTAGAATRAEYQGASITATAPWEAEGISRRTWYRRQARGPPRAESAVSAVAQVRPAPNSAAL